MYYVAKGTVDFYAQPDNPNVPAHGSAEPGQFFGEMALLADERRSSTVRAVQFVELMVLTKEDLFDVMHDYPDIARMLIRIAAEHYSSSQVKEVYVSTRTILSLISVAASHLAVCCAVLVQ